MTGANPDKLGLLDNFCVGNPNDPKELGALVETTKAISAAASAFVSICTGPAWAWAALMSSVVGVPR